MATVAGGRCTLGDDPSERGFSSGTRYGGARDRRRDRRGGRASLTRRGNAYSPSPVGRQGRQRSIVSRTHNSLPSGAREGNLVQYS